MHSHFTLEPPAGWGNYIPSKSADDDACKHKCAHMSHTNDQPALEASERDEAREPQRHGHGVQGQDGELVEKPPVSASLVLVRVSKSGVHIEVGQREEGPG